MLILFYGGETFSLHITPPETEKNELIALITSRPMTHKKTTV